MHEKDLETLEFPKILERLARHADFAGGKELALKLRPSADEKEVLRRLQETSEAITLLEQKADLSLGGVKDIRPLLDKASKLQTLLPQELLDIRYTLLAALRLRKTIQRYEERAPSIAARARRIEDYSWLAYEIGRCINDEGEILDDASPQLRRIRLEMQDAHRRLMDRLQELISSPKLAAFLQEPLITERNGRYVIPVKAQFKSRVPGLVHDVSSSGATFFIEPLEVVELGNAWRELRLAEEEEIRRILRRLTALVAEEEPYIRHTMEILAELDLAFAKARYALELRATIPRIEPWKGPVLRDSFVHPGSTLRLKQARHPLLDPKKVVPIDIYVSDDFFILVITGPNTGGKTVSLKTAGLLSLMAQAGLAIPAEEGSALSVFSGIYADIGDEQSIEQSLSTFSSHMGNIVRILRHADSRSLVILDELGAGTDPVEGAALARALLSHLRERSITTLVATHISELKAYAYATPGVENASVEFDPETLAPTYVLRIGLPGYSNALNIASRLGLDPDIIEQARRFLPPQKLEADALLAQIRETHRQAEEARQEAQQALEKARAWEEELREKTLALEKEKHRILEEIRRQAREELEALRAEVQRIRSRLQVMRTPAEAEEAVREVEKLEEKLPPPPPPPPPRGPIRAGDRVWVEGLDSVGEVLEVNGDEATVLVDAWRVRVPLHRLEKRPSEGAPSQGRPGLEAPVKLPRPKRVPSELSLRGMRVEEALQALDEYLDRAFLAGLEKVRIVHGKGTGALRSAVRERLAGHPLVASFYPAPLHEGGNGVTIVKFNR